MKKLNKKLVAEVFGKITLEGIEKGHLRLTGVNCTKVELTDDHNPMYISGQNVGMPIGDFYDEVDNDSGIVENGIPNFQHTPKPPSYYTDIDENNLIGIGFKKHIIGLDKDIYYIEIDKNLSISINTKKEVSIFSVNTGHIKNFDHITTIKQVKKLFKSLTGKSLK